MLFRRNKERMHFSGRKNTMAGIFSAVIGITVILGFLTISISSGLARGKGGFILGVIGLLLLGLSVFGFVLSVKSFKQKDIFYRFPVIGAILNGGMMIFLLIIYILGFGG